MPHTDPSTVPLATWIWVSGLSLLSGVATWLRRLQSGKPLKRPIATFAFDVVYCLLGGLTTYFLCEAAHLDGWQSAALISLGSHMGARLIFVLEGMFRERLRQTDHPEAMP